MRFNGGTTTLRNTLLWAVALTSALLVTGCRVASQPEQKKDVAADIQEIKANGDQVAAAFNSNNAAAVAALYTDDAILMFPNQAAIEGRQSTQARLEDLFKQNTTTITHHPLGTEGAGDWANERGNSTETITLKSGKPIAESVRCLVTLKRQPDGSWKVCRDMSNRNSKEAT